MFALAFPVTVFDSMLPLLVAGVFLLSLVLLVSMWLVGARVGHVVRALWAIVDQLKHLRHELVKPEVAGPLKPLPEQAVPAHGVKSSMFGR